jgi:hypothetical protein
MKVFHSPGQMNDCSVSWSESQETVGNKGQDWEQKSEMTFLVLVIIPYAVDYKVVSAEGIEPSTY